MILLGAVPTAAVSALLGLEEGFAAWSRWAYLLFFLYGFLVAADRTTQDAMRRDAVMAAVLGALLFAGSAVTFVATDASGVDPLTGTGLLPIAGRILYGAAGWCWLVAIVGLLDRRQRPSRQDGTTEQAHGGSTVRLSRRWPAYLSDAVLPLYILHQPIVVAVAFGVVRWDAPMLVKYAVLVTASLALTVATYDLLVRRTPVTRFLFGMRPKAASDS
jgi:surface polysaccharide O-acyltransferase-like enzyme